MVKESSVRLLLYSNLQYLQLPELTRLLPRHRVQCKSKGLNVTSTKYIVINNDKTVGKNLNVSSYVIEEKQYAISTGSGVIKRPVTILRPSCIISGRIMTSVRVIVDFTTFNKTTNETA